MIHGGISTLGRKNNRAGACTMSWDQAYKDVFSVNLQSGRAKGRDELETLLSSDLARKVSKLPGWLRIPVGACC
jgi:hypothetical protein